MDMIHLSEEQQTFVEKALEGHNVLVNACIGSGKTTAIQLLCDRFSKNKSILYLTYNRLLKIDAQSKIKNSNVKVQNYHGIASYYLNKLNITVGVSDLITCFNEIKPPIDYYDVLIIDEYQDIDTELSFLLEYIKSTNTHMQIIAVGDMQQKIYDNTNLVVSDFIKQFLGNHIELEFTQCFRLSSDLAEKLGRIWCKRIKGVNTDCQVEEMNMSQIVDFLSKQSPQDILCLGSRNGNLSETLNTLEREHPEVFNKRTVYASISDDDSIGRAKPTPKTAIFTTFDSSKGLERKICVIFDYTEIYWNMRISKPQQSYEILRNIFCVAASRGKSRIIFVNSGEAMLSEATLSTRVNENQELSDVEISHMFEFKYHEDIESCYALLQIKKIELKDHQIIKVKSTDGMIDLSPCIGIYQEAMFFDNYEIDKDIELNILIHPKKADLWTKEVKESSIEQKVLFFVSLETNYDRYCTQVDLPFIEENESNQIVNRLLTRFQRNETVQVECQIPFSTERGGNELFIARGFADVVKNNIVYELKFVSELTHEHFLQCACYIAAMNLEKGILWNIRDNTAYKVRIPDKKCFLDAVANTITKHTIKAYYKPNSIRSVPIQSSYIEKAGSTLLTSMIEHTFMVGSLVHFEYIGVGTIQDISTLPNQMHILGVKFEDGSVRKIPLEIELKAGKLKSISNGFQKIRTTNETIPKKNLIQEKYKTGYEDVKNLFIQQNAIIRDRYKIRWVKCEKCGSIKQDIEFASYGGKDHVNLGLCSECSKNKT